MLHAITDVAFIFHDKSCCIYTHSIGNLSRKHIIKVIDN